MDVGEVAVVSDFSENYFFIFQNSVLGIHWNNDLATIYPFVCYFKSSETSEVEKLCFAVISDELTHNTVAVHYFHGLLIKFLKTKVANFNKIFYFSNGAPSQYKNR